MKQRLILCFLLTLAMLYFAIPRLPFSEQGLASVFAFAWVAFAFIVLGGNLIGLLYSKKSVVATGTTKKQMKVTPHKLKRYSR